MSHLYWIFLILTVLLISAQSSADIYSVQPIGRVAKSAAKATLEILPQFQDALLGLNGYSHVLVFYWFDRNDSPEKRAILRVHPRNNMANPLTGVFATRSPIRPNLIGLSVCRIKSINNSSITVDDIDALDGSPIIDLKPYIPASDSIPGASVPEWVKQNHVEPKKPSPR
jgi:tRNA (adenine37-N6)-methyltransferase